MPISVDCPGCSAKLNVPDTAAGKKVKCPKCQTIAPVPAAAPAFEVVEDDEPTPPAPKPKPAPKPAPKPTAKPKAVTEVDDEDEPPRKKPAKVVAQEDEDEDEDEPKPKSKKAKALAQDDEGDRPRKKKRRDEDDDARPRKKKQAAGASMTRNLIGGGVLVVLLVVVGIVYATKFSGDKEKDAASNTNSGDTPPAPTPVGPGPRPTPSGEPNLYTGEGVVGGEVVEWEGEVDVRYQKDLVRDDRLLTILRAPGGMALARVYVRPDQLRKVNELWTGQKVKIRGRKVSPSTPLVPSEFYGTEILSVEPPPGFIEETVDAILTQFRTDKDEAAKKYTTDSDGKRRWVKLTGTFDGTGDSDSGFGGFRLKGAAPPGDGPQHIFVHQAELERPNAKELKVGQPVTVRVSGYVKITEKAVEFGTGLLPLTNPTGPPAKIESPVKPKPPEPEPPSPNLSNDALAAVFIAGEGRHIVTVGRAAGSPPNSVPKARIWNPSGSPDGARQLDVFVHDTTFAAMTGDGQTLAVVVWDGKKYDFAFWAVATGRRYSAGAFSAGGPNDRPTQPVFNIDGTKLVMAVGADVVTIPVFSGRSEVKAAPKKFGAAPLYHPGMHRVVGVVPGPNDRGSELVQWDPFAGGEVKKVTLDTQERPGAFSLSTDGKVVSVADPAGEGNKGRTTIYNAVTGKVLTTLSDEARDFSHYHELLLSHDGKYLAGKGFGAPGSKFRTVDVFRVSDGKQLYRSVGEPGEKPGPAGEFAHTLVFSPDEKLLYHVSLGSKLVRIDVAALDSGTPAKVDPMPAAKMGVANTTALSDAQIGKPTPSNDGKFLLARHIIDTKLWLSVWELPSGRPVASVVNERTSDADAYGISPDGKQVAVVSLRAKNMLLVSLDGQVQKTISLTPRKDGIALPSFATYTPDGKSVLTGFEGALVRVDVQSGAEKILLRDLNTRDSRFSPAANRVIETRYDETASGNVIRVTDPEKPGTPKIIKTKKDETAEGQPDISADGATVAAFVMDRTVFDKPVATVCVYAVATGQLKARVPLTVNGAVVQLSDVRISGDGKRVVACGSVERRRGASTYAWWTIDVAGKSARMVGGEGKERAAVASFASDNKTVAVLSGRVRFYDAETGNEVKP